jgi:hypothetical protein
MPYLSRIPALCVVCLLLLTTASAAPAAEPNDWSRFNIELEVGPVWQTRNDVRIPGDTGTEFSLKDLTGSGPYPSGRVTFDWNIRQRHGLRLIVAPLQFDERGTFDQPVSFSGATFDPETSTTESVNENETPVLRN